MGIGAARNRLIDEARGRFLFFLDADDTIHAETIELLHGAAEQHKAELVYGSRRHSILGDGETGAAIYMNPYKVFTTCDEYAWYAYHERMQVQNWNYLILVDILRRNHLRVTEVGHGYGEDYTFTVDLPTYLSHPNQAEPPYTDREIRDMMWHPMKLLQILGDSDSRGKNLFYWLLGKLPPLTLCDVDADGDEAKMKR